jgi:hypothetical protein
VVTPEGGGIAISEINYHPYDVTAAEATAIPDVVEDDFEFIEIRNTHPTESINLMNMSLAGGLSHTFGSVSLGPGQYALVVENVAAFTARYGPGHNILGTWDGGLGNSGDTVELRDAIGGMLMAVTYTDAAPWSLAADGDGPSLEILDPMGDTSAATNWRASFYDGGTPGGQRETLPGDYNRDRMVNAADHLAWRANFGRSVESELGADGNGDGVVDAADYALWRNNLGATALGSGAVLQQLVAAEGIASEPQPQNRLIAATTDAVFALTDLARPLDTTVSKRPQFRRAIGLAESSAHHLLMALDSSVAVERRREMESSPHTIEADEDSMSSWLEDDSVEALDRALEMLSAN